MEIKAYTDGSCRPNPGTGAWAIVLISEEEILYEATESVENTTNNRMETIAIHEALKAASKYKKLTYLEIHSDSKVALYTISGSWTPKKNKDLIKEAISAAISLEEKGIGIIFSHVKGHSGNKWNEYVDNLANKTAGMQLEKNKTIKSKSECSSCNDKGWIWRDGAVNGRGYANPCDKCNVWILARVPNKRLTH